MARTATLDGSQLVAPPTVSQWQVNKPQHEYTISFQVAFDVVAEGLRRARMAEMMHSTSLSMQLPQVGARLSSVSSSSGSQAPHHGPTSGGHTHGVDVSGGAPSSNPGPDGPQPGTLMTAPPSLSLALCAAAPGTPKRCLLALDAGAKPMSRRLSPCGQTMTSSPSRKLTDRLGAPI